MNFIDYMNAGFIKKNDSYSNKSWSFQNTKRLLLADGTHLSIQASAGHYCNPRINQEDHDYNFYNQFEIGFPSVKIDELMEYAEDPEDPTETVYGWVPALVIHSLVEARGGVVGFVERDDDNKQIFTYVNLNDQKLLD